MPNYFELQSFTQKNVDSKRYNLPNKEILSFFGIFSAPNLNLEKSIWPDLMLGAQDLVWNFEV